MNRGFVGILVLLLVVAGTIFFIVRTDLFIGQNGGKSMLEQDMDAMQQANELKIKLEQNSSYSIGE